MRIFTALFFICFFSLSVLAEPVIFNTNTKKIHKVSCPSAKKCTVNCVKIDRSEAVKKGGIPCKICGGR